MKELETKINKIVELMGFHDFSVDSDDSSRKISIFIDDKIISQENLPVLVLNIDRIARLIAKKMGQKPAIVDVNHYRKERESLIIKLAKAAARKAMATGGSVALPPMNAYERMLVHTELSVRPDVETESTGEDKGRYVVVKLIE